MKVGRRGIWVWFGLSVVVAAAAGSVIFVVSSPKPDSAGALIQTFVVVATAATSVAAWLWARSLSAGVARLSLERAADELAEQLRRQWERAAAERELKYPAPIPLQWKWSHRQVASSLEEVFGSGGCRFAPLPGMSAATPEALRSGALSDLHKVYGSVDSGRLVILGGPGAGKSGAGIILLLDALAHRAGVRADERARVPVPVLLTMQGWDPSQPLVAWLAARLVADYPLLRTPEYGRDAAVRLIEGGYLAIILDGLDEMPEEMRPDALSALNSQAIFRLVVLTRSTELVAAVGCGDDLLRGAAPLELLPINPQQIASYLARSQVDPLPRSWRRLVDHLRKFPNSAVAQALDTPLMISLVRDTYKSGHGVDELIDSVRFPTRETIEDYLLARVLPAAYANRPGQPAPPYTVEQAQRWLGQLASRMNAAGTRDLAWWQIPRWMPAWPRVLITMLVLFFVTVALFGIVAQLDLPVSGNASLITSVAYLGDAFQSACIFGFWLLFMSARGGQPPLRRSGSQWSGTDLWVILVIGVTVGLVLGIQAIFGYGLWLSHVHVAEPMAGLMIGLASALVVGLGFILSGGPPQQWGLLRWSATASPINLLLGFLVGLGVGLLVGLAAGLSCGLRCGLVVGLGVGAGYGLVIAFGGGPSQRRDRLGWSRTATPRNLFIGLVIGLVVGIGAGIGYGLVIAFGGGPSQRRAQLVWSRAVSPTTLLLGLVFGIVCGLVFGFVYQRGLAVGLVIGGVVGLTVGGLIGFGQMSTAPASPLDPRSLWHRERQFGILLGLWVGLGYGLAAGIVEYLMHPDYGFGFGLGYGLVAGPVVGLGVGLVSSATWMTVLASAQLRRRGGAPLRLVRFLDDAHTRQVLRTVGPVYQFRHARLQDRLAEMHDAAR